MHAIAHDSLREESPQTSRPRESLVASNIGVVLAGLSHYLVEDSLRR
jgi:hypothetical protein